MCRHYAWSQIKSAGNISDGKQETAGREAAYLATPGVQIGGSYMEPIARFAIQTSTKADGRRLIGAFGSVTKRSQQEA